MNTSTKNSINCIFFSVCCMFVLVTASLGCQQANSIGDSDDGLDGNTKAASNDVKALIEKMQSPNIGTRVEAAIESTQYPDEVAAFFKPLTELLFEKELEPRYAAKTAFDKLGPKCVELVGPGITSADDNTFVRACEVVNSIGPAAEKWVPAIVENLSSDSVKRQLASSFALIPMGKLVVPYIDKIRPLLTHEQFNVQIFACQIIIGMGKDAMPLASDLDLLSKNGNLSSRSYALWALGAIGNTDDIDVAGLLLERLDVFHHLEKQRALRGLALMGKDAAIAEEKIRELSTKSEASVQPEAAFALWKITGEAKESVELLVKLNNNTIHQIGALEFLLEMGEAAKPAEDHYVKLLSFPDESIQELAIKGLVAIKCNKIGAIEKIQEIAESNPDPILKLEAKNALSVLQGK